MESFTRHSNLYNNLSTTVCFGVLLFDNNNNHYKLKNSSFFNEPINDLKYFFNVNVGCCQSKKSEKIFRKAEEDNTKLIKIVRRFVIAGQIGTFWPSFFTPILYFLFNFPQPEQWFLPFETRFW